MRPNPPSGCTGWQFHAFPYNEGFESGFWRLDAGCWLTTLTGLVDVLVLRHRAIQGLLAQAEGSQYIFMESSSPNYSTKRAVLVVALFRFGRSVSQGNV